ncbi:hypothetical protein CB7_136 [Pectobacterium phage vB_PatM_CB7]|nr:hypothetical protein CB7_136 [Pectobacterium phage vB_PatM_CB7]QQG33447.1 hypothetical protein [Pectobacterium phage PcCB7V]
MKLYFINIPGIAGPLKIYGYNEQDARKRLRDREGFGSRPHGELNFICKTLDVWLCRPLQ